MIRDKGLADLPNQRNAYRLVAYQIYGIHLCGGVEIVTSLSRFKEINLDMKKVVPNVGLEQ